MVNLRGKALTFSQGELYAWGRNDSCCCAAPPSIVFVPRPRLVDCLFVEPLNIARSKRAYQSSTLNERDADSAINGSTDGNGESQCACTQMDSQAWWELDLGDYAKIDRIHLWNRSDSPKDKNLADNYYSRRLFPCWVMIGNEPFSTLCTGHALRENIRRALFKVKFTEENRLSIWRCPSSCRGRYVRVQLEGYNFLSINEVQVFGTPT